MARYTALLSVYNKDGIVDFAKELIALDFDLLASGGTAKALAAAGVPVRDVADLVGSPLLGHRVVTLSREIHAGLLALPQDRNQLVERNIPWIDLVCVDLYPLEDEIAKPDKTLYSVIEKTDIGGPTMLRAAAKGRRIVISDPADRGKVLAWFKENRPQELAFTGMLVAKAEFVAASYALASATYHGKGEYDGIVGRKVADCKYGENAWQTPAALYSTGSDDPLALDRFEVVAGQPPSYNNWCDIDRMLQIVTHIAAAVPRNAIAVAVKHGNACGAALEREVADSPCEVLKRTIEGDTRAIFGGLVLTTFAIDEALAETILTHRMEVGRRRLLDGIVAPSFTDEAIEMLKRKGDKCRFIVNPTLARLSHPEMKEQLLDAAPRRRYVRGGFLQQPNYTYVPAWETFSARYDLSHVEMMRKAKEKYPEQAGQAEYEAEKFVDRPGVNYEDCMLAWAVGSTSNSNTITLVKGGMLIGNGVGQQDRVGCCELALKRARDAGHDTKGAVAYSDSFFPFPDGPKVLIDAGISVIFTTSGSVNDEKTRKICEDAGVQLYMLPDAQARGFFGH